MKIETVKTNSKQETHKVLVDGKQIGFVMLQHNGKWVACASLKKRMPVSFMGYTKETMNEAVEAMVKNNSKFKAITEVI